jgi:hypothetical protein
MRDVKSRPRKLNAKGLIAGSLSLRIDPHRKVDAESMRIEIFRTMRMTEGQTGVTHVSSILAFWHQLQPRE